MSKDLDAELDEIGRTHAAARAKGQQEAEAAAKATQNFSQAWESCRTSIVMPTLNSLVAKLTSRQLGSHVAQVRVSGISFILPSAPGSGKSHNSLTIQPSQPSGGGGSILFTHNDGQGDSSESYTVEKVTRELIEQEAMKLVRKVYGGG
jgi:hypothetical protein